MGALLGLVSMMAPLLTKLLVDEVFPTQDRSLMELIVLGGFVLAIVISLTTGIRNAYVAWMKQRLGAEMSVRFFERLVQLPMSFLEQRSTGEVVTRAQDTQRSLAFALSCLETTCLTGIQFVALPIILIWLDWRLALVVLMLVPVTISLTLAGGRITRRLAHQVATRSAESGAVMIEATSNMRTVKALVAEAHLRNTFDGAVEDLRRSQTQMALWSNMIGIAVGGSRAVGMAALTWIGWHLILSGQLSLGGYIAFTMYLGLLNGPIGAAVTLGLSFHDSAAALGRALEYLEQPVELYSHGIPSTTLSERSSVEGAELEVQGVTFGYEPGREVLRDLSFRLHASRCYAVVGPSGSGKSSLARVLVRMYEPHSGRILLDGTPIDQEPVDCTRKIINVVWQENGLFRGTLRDNVTLGLHGVDDARVMEALELAQLGEFTQQVAAGMHAPIGEWGASLSGGERQRVAVARALVRSPRLLILDEATANLDVANERALLEAVLSRKGMTTLLITHRADVANRADAVFYLADGGLRGGATHSALMETDRDYRALWWMSDSVSAYSERAMRGEVPPKLHIAGQGR